MKSYSKNRTFISQDRIVPEGHKIFLFKKGSRGEVVGVYDSVKEIVELEKRFHTPFSGMYIYQTLLGLQKSFTSYNHQCRVIAKVLPYEKKANPAA